MARRDVIKYYTNCVKQYKDLNDTVAELQKAFEEGKVSEEQVEQFKPMVENMFANCQTVGYIVYLLNLPTFSFKKFKDSVKAKKLLDYFKEIKVDKETISTNNDEVLNLLHKTLEEIKEVKNG